MLRRDLPFLKMVTTFRAVFRSNTNTYIFFPDKFPIMVPTPDLLSYDRPAPLFCHSMSYLKAPDTAVVAAEWTALQHKNLLELNLLISKDCIKWDTEQWGGHMVQTIYLLGVKGTDKNLILICKYLIFNNNSQKCKTWLILCKPCVRLWYMGIRFWKTHSKDLVRQGIKNLTHVTGPAHYHY